MDSRKSCQRTFGGVFRAVKRVNVRRVDGLIVRGVWWGALGVSGWVLDRQVWVRELVGT